MSLPKFDDSQWQLAEGLAQTLARRRVSQNLVRQATTYLLLYPGSAALRDWLNRLVKLGDTFASGRETLQEREVLHEVLSPLLEKYPKQNWSLILAWAARLMLYYAPQRRSKPQYSRRSR